MLRQPQGARRYNDSVMLTISTNTKDAYGHMHVGDPVDVLEVPASVSQMSSTKTMMTFELANVVGLEIEFRDPGMEFNGIRWRGHSVCFPNPTDVGNRGRITKISGYYQVDAL